MQSGSDNALTYYRYFYEDLIADASLTIGNVVIPESITNNIFQTKNGYSLTNYETNGEGSFYDERSTLANAYVDIYVNGIFVKTVQANDSGRYIVDGFSVMPGDMVNFKERIGIGEIVNTQIHIANTSESVLKQGYFAYSIQGEMDRNQRKRSRFSYGIKDNFTLGISAFHSTLATELTAGFRAIPTSNIGITFAWIAKENKLLGEVDFNFNANHYLKINYNRSDLFSNDDDTRFNQLEYRYYNSIASFNINAIQTKTKINTNIIIRSQLNSYLSASLMINDIHTNNNPYTEYTFTTNYIRSTTETLELELLQSSQYSELLYNANYRYQCVNCFFSSIITSNQSYYNIRASYKKELTVSASVAVEFNQNIKLTANATHDSISLLASYSYGLKISKVTDWQLSSIDPNHYGYATVRGQIVDHTGTPVPNIGLSIYRKKTRSDANGIFVLDGVAIADNIALKLNPKTIDINLQPQYNPLLINTQKGGITDVIVRLNRVFGLDGIITNFDGHSEATITFINNNTQHQLTYKIEDDGFFMIEGLTAADYTITYKAGERQASMEWSALNQQQWLSNIQLQIDCIDKTQQCTLSMVSPP
ncbi:hypothetical protein UA42_00590 [Photobacterium kishitanii]|uniref:Carboxypeptidase regulatory-like domain-containing protein n=3 Tax=Photobacterium kishitanii TaxID=318456 RepID=A0AAX0YWG8_9GAMM|nr:carboxypeptidase-like regulatory domain-containing protein [Photobacterium kishitanii]KJG10634.1 hypothetical protein UB40_04500 [Photobacterium kishitanii]KJG62937.1 hypothetical protein UA42_00590 [Photobacterium kishitanii]KJG71111.1 hypothetical protein UA41_00240 [Photobacterium kishitanii]PSV07958.1 carboxypeptidase regulatory-like domain-containing protein [Photobacterium kishitanii]PSV75344.1 carboxypeptidase regulatory-like domain-containing protein [Photobacterium kishitanii]